jgi:hypothetical protein
MATALPISQWDADDESNNGKGVADEGQTPSSVNDGMRRMMGATRAHYEDLEWRDWGHTPTRTSNTTFAVPGDFTSVYHVGRRLRLEDSSTLYGTITDSSFGGGNTTVTVSLDSGVLSVVLSAVSVGFAANTQSIPPGAVTQTVGEGLTQPRNLIVENNSGNPNTQLDISADEIEVSDGSGKVNLQNVSETCAITSFGAGGLEAIETLTGTYSTTGTAVTGVTSAFDTEFQVGDVLRSDTKVESRRITNIASAISMTLESGFSTDVGAGETVKRGGEAPNAWYFPYVIYNQGTSDVSSLLSTQPDTPNNPPAGYTFFRRVSAVRNDGSGNFKRFSQIGSRVVAGMGTILNQGSATTFTSVDASAAVPPTSRIGIFYVNLLIDHNTANIGFRARIRINGDNLIQPQLLNLTTQVANIVAQTSVGQMRIPLDSSQSFEYKIEASPSTGGGFTVNGDGWIDSL